MRRHLNNDHRCRGCWLQRRVCICAELPSLDTRTQVVLLVHQLELRKTTNTGRIALRCLTNSRFAVHGRLEEAHQRHGEAVAANNNDDDAADVPASRCLADDWLQKVARPVLLFPGEDARPLSDFAGARDLSPAPRTLIVPDGTWSQAARMRKRIPGLASIPCAHLPMDMVSVYRLRHDPRPGYLSTLQAIAHALGILDDPIITEQLLRVHRLAVERTLWTKGRLAGHLVEGGVPLSAAAARARDSEARKPDDG